MTEADTLGTALIRPTDQANFSRYPDSLSSVVSRVPVCLGNYRSSSWEFIFIASRNKADAFGHRSIENCAAAAAAIYWPHNATSGVKRIASFTIAHKQFGGVTSSVPSVILRSVPKVLIRIGWRGTKTASGILLVCFHHPSEIMEELLWGTT